MIGRLCECGNHAWAPLTRGFVTLVSSRRLALLQSWKWYAKRHGHNWYAAYDEAAKRVRGDLVGPNFGRAA